MEGSSRGVICDTWNLPPVIVEDARTPVRRTLLWEMILSLDLPNVKPS
jgi:hypothetical protein